MVKQINIVIFLSRLMLFRATMVIHGKQNIASLPAGGADIDRRFSTVTTYFETGAQAGNTFRKPVKCFTLFIGKKAFY